MLVNQRGSILPVDSAIQQMQLLSAGIARRFSPQPPPWGQAHSQRIPSLGLAALSQQHTYSLAGELQ